MFVSTPCFSKWEKVVEDEFMIFYIDTKSVILGGDSSFYYLKTTSKDGTPSKYKNPIRCSLSYVEIDCKNGMNRYLTDELYTDKNCSKLVQRKKKPGNWRSPKPQSVMSGINSRFCKN